MQRIVPERGAFAEVGKMSTVRRGLTIVIMGTILSIMLVYLNNCSDNVAGNGTKKDSDLILSGQNGMDLETIKPILRSRGWEFITGPGKEQDESVQRVIEPGVFSSHFKARAKVSQVKLCYKWHIIGRKIVGPNVGLANGSSFISIARKIPTIFIDCCNNEIIWDLSHNHGVVSTKGAIPVGPKQIETGNGRKVLIFYLQQIVELYQAGKYVDSAFMNNCSSAIFQFSPPKKEKSQKKGNESRVKRK